MEELEVLKDRLGVCIVEDKSRSEYDNVEHGMTVNDSLRSGHLVHGLELASNSIIIRSSF